VPIHTELVFWEQLTKIWIHSKQAPFAIDKILFYYKAKEVTFENIIKFKDYYILGYYDSNKSYIMRKFTDGYN
jgi:hypothetical protein